MPPASFAKFAKRSMPMPAVCRMTSRGACSRQDEAGHRELRDLTVARTVAMKATVGQTVPVPTPSSNAVRRVSVPAASKTPWERLPLDVLPVTHITEQCYCEHRVHLWLKAPSSMVSVPRKLEGRSGPGAVLRQAADAGLEFHRRAGDVSGQVVQSTLRKAVRSAPSVVLAESPLFAQFGDLPIAGIPDAVHFEQAVGRCVLDYKVTDSNQLQMGHRVQLLLYGWLLQESGLRLSDALLVSVLVPPVSAAAFDELEESDRLRLAVTLHQYARALVEEEPDRVNWYVKRLPLSEDFWVRLRIFRYDRRHATRELKFFVPYWRGERTAIPTSNLRKCRVCLYNGLGTCKQALAPFDGAL